MKYKLSGEIVIWIVNKLRKSVENVHLFNWALPQT